MSDVLEYGELKDALDGLFAWDAGCSDSGIHDERLRQRVRDYVRTLAGPERRELLARIARDLYLSDDALRQGYGLPDVEEFISWLGDQGINASGVD